MLQIATLLPKPEDKEGGHDEANLQLMNRGLDGFLKLNLLPPTAS